MTDIIVLENVEKVYKRDALEIPVLKDITLKVPQGEYLALMGPSGSGKTTLLNLIAGIDQPTRGRILVGGVDISTVSQSELAKWRSHTIGFIFQLYNLIPVLTAFENVELPLLLTKLSRAERRRHVETALSIVGLSDRMDHYPAAALRRAGAARRDRAGDRHRPDDPRRRRADGRPRREVRGGDPRSC